MSIFTARESERFKAEIWGEHSDAQFRGLASRQVVVAEGDSWFDYPLNRDILDYLKHRHGFAIKKFSKHGDTVYRMAFGPQLDDVKAAVSGFDAGIVLLSAGGNDVAGPDLLPYLSGTEPRRINESFATTMFGTVFRAAYQYIIDSILAVRPATHIFAHGYGEPIPSGVGFMVVGIPFNGPWLKPYLDARGIGDPAEAREAIRVLMTMFNDLLAELDVANPHFHYIDLRPHIQDTDWENELHLNNRAYARMADVFADAIRRFVP